MWHVGRCIGSIASIHRQAIRVLRNQGRSKARYLLEKGCGAIRTPRYKGRVNSSIYLLERGCDYKGSCLFRFQFLGKYLAPLEVRRNSNFRVNSCDSNIDSMRILSTELFCS